LKTFSVKIFQRLSADDGKLAEPVKYKHVATETVDAWQPKAGAETAATQFNARATDPTQRIKIGDILVLGGTAFEFRIMGWVERSDPDFIGVLGILGVDRKARWSRKIGVWKIKWERMKAEMGSK
jgi:hypothetical protein